MWRWLAKTFAVDFVYSRFDVTPLTVALLHIACFVDAY
jgi:hypothetical protein